MLALPIFPASRPASIVGASELNFCVRDGNRWTLTAINTNCMSSSFLENINYYTTLFPFVKQYFSDPFYRVQPNEVVASGSDEQRNDRAFELARMREICSLRRAGDPYRIRTDVNGVRGHCLNHLTNGPFGAPSRTRTGDPLIKSQLLYQLS